MKKIIGIVLVGFFLLFGCSTRKDTFINRGYHNVTTKYNVLYNGNVALEKGIAELNSKYEDDFWTLLPIEPIKIDETLYVLPGKSKEKTDNSFDIAEQKAVKAVQKHSMNIAGREHNKQIDDAYFLLGKARYYSQRFVPALEAFDYVLKHYPNGNLNKELRIWKAKTQIRLQNEEQAIIALQNLLKSKKTDKNIKEQAYTALAMAYLALDSTKQATKQLEKAVITDEDKEQHARNLFILGQLYRQEQNLDSSQLAFLQILDFKKAPRKYKIHAYIEQVKNATDSTDLSPLKDQLNKLLKNSLNKPYFDELYYQIAQMNFKENNEAEALKNLEKSIRTPLVKDFQKGLSYENLGNYYFDKADFIKAGAYYDSVIPTVTNPNTKRIRKLNRKRKSLEDVILYETTLKYNDSILQLVAMSDDERKEYFTEYVDKLRKADELVAILKENSERSGTAGNAFSGGSKQNSKNGKWYFYNIQTVGFGKAEFQKVWGKRDLKDNWRWSDKSTNSIDVDKQENAESNTENIDESKKYDITYYIKQIPKEVSVLQKIKADNSDALYQLGLIYKEKFQEYPLAINRLERFLSEEPKEKLILPAKYHLYKMYEKTGDSNLNNIKEEIITEYPDSRYAQLIQNPDKISFDTGETPEAHYESVYCDFEYEKYSKVIEDCNKAITRYVDDPIQAKFELLKVYAQLKIQNDKASFMKGLEFVVANYPKTVESDHAQEVLNLLNGVKTKKDNPQTGNKGKIINKTKKENSDSEGKIKPLSDEEKRKKVLELMRKNAPPKSQDNEKEKTN